jgi:hypothetical protein
MVRQAQIVMGSQSYEGLKKAASENKTDWWSCGKRTKKNDLLFFYFKRPKSEIVALATASDDAEPNEDWRYGVDIENVELIDPPISLEKLREVFPKWDWLKQTRNLTYLDEPKAKQLLNLANQKRKPTAEPAAMVTVVGAGFGTPEQNRIVEHAACKAVRIHFAKKGYQVVSREEENLGYDFDVCRKGEELHVEVKGLSGSHLRFPVAANEVACARSDSKFQLVVVTETSSHLERIQEFSRKDFLSHFELRPLAFFAEAKGSLYA